MQTNKSNETKRSQGKTTPFMPHSDFTQSLVGLTRLKRPFASPLPSRNFAASSRFLNTHSQERFYARAAGGGEV